MAAVCGVVVAVSGGRRGECVVVVRCMRHVPGVPSGHQVLSGQAGGWLWLHWLLLLLLL